MPTFCFKILFLSVFSWYFIFPTFSYSQEDKYKEESSYKRGDMDLYISPFAIIEPRSTIYLGAEYFLSQKFSIYTELGYMSNPLASVLNTEIDTTSSIDEQIDQIILNSFEANYVIKTEFRWYREGSTSKNAFYYGLRLMWRNVNYLKNQRIYKQYEFSTLTNNWTGIGEEQISIYKVKRNTVGMQFLFGGKDRFSTNLILNWYMGVGVRYISNIPTKKFFNPLENIDTIYEDLNIDFLKFNKRYQVVTMDFALGVRFGGKIKR